VLPSEAVSIQITMEPLDAEVGSEDVAAIECCPFWVDGEEGVHGWKGFWVRGPLKGSLMVGRKSDGKDPVNSRVL
jgi:hypothetical protein